MNENDVKPPAFCPACGAKVRRSLTERIGISADDLSILTAIVLVGAILLGITGLIVYGCVVSGQDKRSHEGEMAKTGYVQATKCLDPSTNFRNGKYVTEWVKQEDKKP